VCRNLTANEFANRHRYPHFWRPGPAGEEDRSPPAPPRGGRRAGQAGGMPPARQGADGGWRVRYGQECDGTSGGGGVGGTAGCSGTPSTGAWRATCSSSSSPSPPPSPFPPTAPAIPGPTRQISIFCIRDCISMCGRVARPGARALGRGEAAGEERLGRARPVRLPK
jgi:hypothetical protein